MTPTFSADQMLAIARVVYSNYSWTIDNGEVVAPAGGSLPWSIPFNPSLTGAKHEKACALDTILAASHSLSKGDNPANWGRFFYDPGYLHACVFEFGKTVDADEVQCDDILTASMHAILQHTSGGG